LSNSKAARRKGLADVVKDLQKNQKRENGVVRQNFSGLGSADFGGVTASASSGAGATNSIPSHSSTDLDGVLQTVGDTMVGPIAFYLKSATVANGVIKVSKGEAYSSRVIVTGQGGVADDLEVIVGASHAGQILFFQPVQAITLQSYLKTATAWANGTSYSVGDVILSASQRYTCHTAHTAATATNKPGTGTDWESFWYINNIRITGTDDREVAVDEIILLQYDTTDGVWTVISGGGGGSGANQTLSNLTSPTAINQDLNMQGNSLALDTDKDTYIESTTDDTLIMQVGGSSAITINNSDILTSKHISVLIGSIKMNTNPINFQDTGQSITSTSGGIIHSLPTSDTHGFSVNGDLKLSISGSGTTLTDDLDMNGNDIENIDRLDFQVTGQRLNSTSSSIQYEVPSGDVHKFLVSSVSKVTIDSNGLNVITGDLDMAYGTTINFNSSVTTSRTGGAAAALPSAPVGYFLIKLGGNFRYVPYYS